jgi:hypothetical protein
MYFWRADGTYVVLPGENLFLRFGFELARAIAYGDWEPLQEDGGERDEYDPRAPYVVTILRGRVVGGCRLVPISETGSCPLPMLKKHKVDREIVRPSVEISRMLCLVRCVREELYRGIYDALRDSHWWGPPISTAYAAVRPVYLRLLQKDFSPEAFYQIGRDKIFETPTGHAIRQVPIEVNLDAWGKCYHGKAARKKNLVAA